MAHFKEPHNFGEIKDADGVGKVGNKQCGDVMYLYIKVKNNKIADIKFQTFGCLPSNEKILTKEGDWFDISKIKYNDTVLNSDGNKDRVVKIFERKYNGKLLKIIPFVSPYNSFYVTPEHPVLSIKRSLLRRSRKTSTSCNLLRINERELIKTKPDFFDAIFLEKGDYLVFVPNKEVVNDEIYTKDMMRLLGYYLSEGHICANNSVVAFSFNKNEIKYINETKELIYKILNKNASERTRGNVCEVYVCSRKLAKLIIKSAGKLAKKKKLSHDVLVLPVAKQMQMLQTYMNGDGNSYKRRANNFSRYRANTTSEMLAIQIQEVLARIGIFSSIKKVYKPETFIENRKIKASIQYEISYQIERGHKFIHKCKDYYLVPIRKIVSENYNGKVYNIEVQNNPHSYLVKGFAVHNCVAAIATSSIITDMAKGKTIAAAKKLTKESIVKKLGGLPLIKYHCSILAIDALQDAIKDYEVKKK